MAGWALVGMTSANAISHGMRLSPLRDQGIHGFNGVLVDAPPQHWQTPQCHQPQTQHD